MSKKLDLTGHVYGRLTVTSSAGYAKGFSLWVCMCECGTETITRGNCLRTGNTTSCGCLSRELTAGLNRTHRLSKTKTYTVWKAMLTRCRNPNQPTAARYVLRGISVCDRWETSFENFYADMGAAPPGLSLDRIDNDGNYEPGNCRWATAETQSRNRAGRNGRVRGVSWVKTLKKWRVTVCVGKDRHHIGVFKKMKDAVSARKAAEKIYWT